jgi:hypothetical protein
MTEQTKKDSKLSEQQTKMLSDIDFTCIPSSDQFQKIKVKPENR